MPFSLTLLGFFLASELYEVYCKANGEVDLALVSTTVFRFIIPFFVVLHSYDIIQLIFTSFNGLLSSLSASIVTAMPEPSVDYDAIVASISTYGLLELLACMQQMMGQMSIGLSQIFAVELHQIRVLMGFAQYLALILAVESF